MLSFGQSIAMGLLQGFSELFPISSLGHSVILPQLLGWQIDQKAGYFLTFLVATHLATALVLLGFFWADWKRIITGIFLSLKKRRIHSTDAKLGWLLIVGTVPAGILGLLFEEHLKNLFAEPRLVAVFLIANGFLLLGAEMLRRRSADKEEKGSDERIAKLGWGQSLLVGSMQALALIPGISRTGSALSGGLLVGLSHEDAARFSFLLATPIIAAAGLLKLPELTLADQQTVAAPILAGALASALTAYLSVRFLIKYFRTNTLTPFAIYCLAAGALATFRFFLS